MATLADILRMLQTGWAPDVETEGVRPGYGLGTATGISSGESPLVASFGPGEQATLEDVRGSLGHILLGGLAPGSLPGITARPVEVRPASRPRPQTPIMRRPQEAVGGATLAGLLKSQDVRPDIPAGETYYSQLRRTISTRHVQEKQTADAWLRFLRKPQRQVHEDELTHTGVGPLLKSKGRSRVTKTELLEHLDANEIRVEEVTKGGGRVRTQEETQPEIDRLTRGAQRAQQRGDREGANRLFGRAEALTGEVENTELGKGPTKFGTYTLPGAKNYREVLLRLPTPSFDQTIKAGGTRADYNAAVKRRPAFEGGHWDEANVLAHLRLSDRTTGGKRTLLVEEVQSDWAQKGRSAGFQKKTLPEDWKIRRLTTGEMEGFGVWDEANKQLIVRAPTEVEARRHALEYYNRELTGGGPGIPFAPFVEKTAKWTTLALKRVLKLAADEGYDRVGIVRGAEQAERYDLSKQIDSLAFTSYPAKGEGQGVLQAWKHGQQVISKVTSESDLVDHVGKEPAQKLLAAKPDKGGRRSIKGVDLKVGGAGMKAFYDVIVPEQLNKLGKEYGVRVQIEGGTVGLEHGKTFHPPSFPIHIMDIPESMKQRVKKKGFPLVSSTLADLLTRTA